MKTIFTQETASAVFFIGANKMIKVKNHMIAGLKTGEKTQPDGSEMTRITSKDFEGWFYSADLEKSN